MKALAFNLTNLLLLFRVSLDTIERDWRRPRNGSACHDTPIALGQPPANGPPGIRPRHQRAKVIVPRVPYKHRALERGRYKDEFADSWEPDRHACEIARTSKCLT